MNGNYYTPPAIPSDELDYQPHGTDISVRTPRQWDRMERSRQEWLMELIRPGGREPQMYRPVTVIREGETE